jgi:hypothetical protein
MRRAASGGSTATAGSRKCPSRSARGGIARGDTRHDQRAETAETYDPLTGALEKTGDMVAPIYSGLLATLLRDGKVFVPGYPTAQVYDPVTRTFAATLPWFAAFERLCELTDSPERLSVNAVARLGGNSDHMGRELAPLMRKSRDQHFEPPFATAYLRPGTAAQATASPIWATAYSSD